MKIIKLIIAAAILATLLGSCRSKLCPGYGELENDNNQKIEQLA
jgi:outer membrane murein-binding lipoprotein Lpp